MKKLLTHKAIKKSKLKGELKLLFMWTVAIFLLFWAVGLYFSNDEFNKTFFTFAFVGVVFSVLFFLCVFLILKNHNKNIYYTITKEKVLTKKLILYRHRYKDVEITFENSGKWKFKGEKMYCDLNTDDEIFVIKNMDNFLIVAVFDANEYEIPLDEFEFKNSRYYSKGYTDLKDII